MWSAAPHFTQESNHMNSALVKLQMQGPIAWITMRDPKGVNALSAAMIDGLSNALVSVKAAKDCRVVVVQAEGKAFCVGHDLKDMQAARAADDKGHSAFEALFQSCTQMMLAIRALPQPVIAAVDGIATAAGCQLVAACDLAIATPNARFGVNGIDVGLFCSTPMVAVSRGMKPRHAFELLVTGDFLTADKALEKGLINDVVSADGLHDRVTALAQSIASKQQSAVAIGKAAFYQQLEMPLEDAYQCGTNAIISNLMLAETSEGMATFADKSKRKDTR